MPIRIVARAGVFKAIGNPFVSALDVSSYFRGGGIYIRFLNYLFNALMSLVISIIRIRK